VSQHGLTRLLERDHLETEVLEGLTQPFAGRRDGGIDWVIHEDWSFARRTSVGRSVLVVVQDGSAEGVRCR
jgi:hypothetical protein